jgi:hypothetical protein
MLHGLGAVAAIRLAPTSTGTSIVRAVRVRSESLSVDNRNDQHRGKYGCHCAHGYSPCASLVPLPTETITVVS